MGKLRKILFLVFVGLYLVIAPFTVLYALGYIFNPLRQQIFQTGLVSLNSVPPRAFVWVNELPIKDRTPLILRNLKPGDYHLRVSLPGHHEWEKKIKVEPEVALRFEDIFLFPHQFEFETLTNFPISRMWYPPEGTRLVVLKGNKASGLLLFEIDRKKFEPLFTQDYYKDAGVEELYLHPAGDHAIVILQKEKGRLPVLVRFGDPTKITNLTDLLQEPFREIRWSQSQKDWIFYLKGNTLMRLDLERNVLYPAIARSIQGFELEEHDLFVLDAKSRFLQMSERGKIRKILLDDPSKVRLVFGSDANDFYSIYFLRNDAAAFLSKQPILLFLSKKGKLLSNKLPYFLDEGVSNLVAAVSSPRIIYRKGDELWGIDFEREEEKTFFESGPVPRKIYKGRRTPRNLLWFYRDKYILFTEGAWFSAKEFDGEDHAIKLFPTSRRVGQIFFDRKEGFFYFAHPETDYLSRAKLAEPGETMPQLVVDLVRQARK